MSHLQLPPPTLTFSLTLSSLSSPTPKRYGPRLGVVSLKRGAPGSLSPSSLSSSTNSERPEETQPQTQIKIQTPGLITGTSRGVIPHLSRDHYRKTRGIRWVDVVFESFLEHTPPVPVLYASSLASSGDPTASINSNEKNDKITSTSSRTPLHTFLGFSPEKHIVSMTARDPEDVRDMPPNGANHIVVGTLRGVRKITPTEWRTYTRACNPDIVFALSDTPIASSSSSSSSRVQGQSSFSQKRLMKSVERSAAWLGSLLTFGSSSSSSSTSTSTSTTAPTPTPSTNTKIPPIFVHMAGLTSHRARSAFADALLEPLYGPEAEAIGPLKTLDEGVVGYSFDLGPMRALRVGGEDMGESGSVGEVEGQVEGQGKEEKGKDKNTPTPTHLSTSALIPLLRTSLSRVPSTKPRILNGARSPHEMLSYIGEVGIDLFDARWAQKAADVGVALDFEFPVRDLKGEEEDVEGEVGRKRKIGHNLYDTKYRFDFSPFADAFRGAYVSPSPSNSNNYDNDKPICPCLACSPSSPSSTSRIYHGVDDVSFTHPPSSPSINSTATATTTSNANATLQPPFTRAYTHHLLHTHEMSAHALLAMHNLSVLDAFFGGVRDVLRGVSVEELDTEEKGEEAEAEAEKEKERWDREVSRFFNAYDSDIGALMRAAEDAWGEVDKARGKGRLAREKKKVEEGV